MQYGKFQILGSHVNFNFFIARNIVLIPNVIVVMLFF